MRTKTQTKRKKIPSDANDTEYYRTTAAPDTMLATFTDEEDLTGERKHLGNASGSSGILTDTSHHCVDTHDTASVILSLECWLMLS